VTSPDLLPIFDRWSNDETLAIEEGAAPAALLDLATSRERIAVFDRIYKRNNDGEFSSGGGGGDHDLADDEEGLGDVGPTGQELIGSVKVGGHAIASFVDHGGDYGPEDSRIVSVADDGERAAWGSDGPSAGHVFTAEQAHQVAGGIESMAEVVRTAPEQSNFEDGPAMLGTVHTGTLHVSAFEDGGDDLVGGGRFIQVRDDANFADSLSPD